MRKEIFPNYANTPNTEINFDAEDDPRLRKSPLLPLIAHSFDGIALIEYANGELIYVNPALATWLHRQPSELIGKHIDSLFEAAVPEAFLEQIEAIGSSVSNSTNLTARLNVAGDALPVEVRLCRVEWEGRVLVGIVVQRTMAARRTDEVAETQRRDPLTGLSDRGFLFERLEALLHGDRAADRQFAVLFVDLNNFKEVNDTHGHIVGDRVLHEVARRLAKCVRDGDHVVRYGGDEFVVLLEWVSAWHDIAPVIKRIHATLQSPIELVDGEVFLSVSIGVAEASPDHQTPEDLLSDADRAMYASKRSGG